MTAHFRNPFVTVNVTVAGVAYRFRWLCLPGKQLDQHGSNNASKIKAYIKKHQSNIKKKNDLIATAAEDNCTMIRMFYVWDFSLFILVINVVFFSTPTAGFVGIPSFLHKIIVPSEPRWCDFRAKMAFFWTIDRRHLFSTVQLFSSFQIINGRMQFLLYRKMDLEPLGAARIPF